MNSAGIDVSNGRSTVAVLRPPGEVVRTLFEVRHDAVSLSALARELKSFDGEVRVIMEHTGRYYEAVAKSLHEAGLFVSKVCEMNVERVKFSLDKSQQGWYNCLCQ